MFRTFSNGAQGVFQRNISLRQLVTVFENDSKTCGILAQILHVALKIVSCNIPLHKKYLQRTKETQFSVLPQRQHTIKQIQSSRSNQKNVPLYSRENLSSSRNKPQLIIF